MVLRKLIVASLGAYVAASPFPQNPEGQNICSANTCTSSTVEKGEAPPPADQDEKAWCAPSADMNWDNAQLVAERMSGMEVVVEAIIKVYNGGEQDDWLAGFESKYWGEARSSEHRADCSRLILDCEVGHPDSECGQWFNKYEGGDDAFMAKRAYYIFRAVRGIQKKFTLLKAKLLDSTIINGLQLENIAKDLDGPSSKATLNKIATTLTNAIIVGGIAFGRAFPLAGIYGPAIGISLATGWQAMSSDDELDLGSIESALGAYFEASAVNLENTLRTVMGYPNNRTDTDFTYEDLPNLTTNVYNDILKYPVAKFFGSPMWLVDSSDPGLTEVLDLGMKMTRWKMIDSILQQLGYAVTAAKDYEDEKTCNDGTEGRKWLKVDDKYRCFSLYLRSSDGRYSPVGPEKNIYKKMAKYGLEDLEGYYKNAIQCAKENDSGDTDFTRSNQVEGQLPMCFYNIPVKYADRISIYGNADKCGADGPWDTCVWTDDLFKK